MRWEKCGEEWAEQMKPHEGSNMVAAGLGHRRLWLLMKPGSLVFIREVAADRSSRRSSDPHRWRLCSHSAMMMMNLNTHLQGGSWGLLYCFIYNQICPNILEKVFLNLKLRVCSFSLWIFCIKSITAVTDEGSLIVQTTACINVQTGRDTERVRFMGTFWKAACVWGGILDATAVCACIYVGSGALGDRQTDGSTHWIMSPVRSLQSCMSLTG